MQSLILCKIFLNAFSPLSRQAFIHSKSMSIYLITARTRQFLCTIYLLHEFEHLSQNNILPVFKLLLCTIYPLQECEYLSYTIKFSFQCQDIFFVLFMHYKNLSIYSTTGTRTIHFLERQHNCFAVFIHFRMGAFVS